jgi:hypothetical protein
MAKRQMKNPDLPELGYIVRRDDPRAIVIVENGSIGFYPYQTCESAHEAAQLADRLNMRLQITKDQARAMEAASMFGWHIPMVAEILEGRS